MSLPPVFNTVIILVERLSGYTSKSFYNIFKLNERQTQTGNKSVDFNPFVIFQQNIEISQLISILS